MLPTPVHGAYLLLFNKDLKDVEGRATLRIHFARKSAPPANKPLGVSDRGALPCRVFPVLIPVLCFTALSIGQPD